MEKQQYISKHLNLNIQQSELDRKWRLYVREQEEMELMLRTSQSTTSTSGKDLLYMDTDYMEDELNYVQ